MKTFISTLAWLFFAAAFCRGEEQPADTGQDFSIQTKARPLVEGGIGDKPFITGYGGRASIGGYVEAHFIWEREAGVTEELTFDPRRMNLFAYSALSERVSFFTEVEFEEGGEEIKVEAAIIDFVIHEALALRGGILLSPLGKFNLTHDSPRNEVNERPLVATDLIGVALSEPGMGFFGSLYPRNKLRLTYEIYAVNGYNDGLITKGAVTSIPLGKSSLGEDNNNQPAFVGRIAFIWPHIESGISLHTGNYNHFEADGLQIDQARNLSIMAWDGEVELGGFDFRWEYAQAEVDIPSSLVGIYASRQRGAYAEIVCHFGHRYFKLLPDSYWSGVVRIEGVDFDRDIEGDMHHRLTLGLNFRPIPDTVFKLDYRRDWIKDRVNTLVHAAGISFGMATYF
jgi:hypothetical protein